MSTIPTAGGHEQLSVPDTLVRQLRQFRDRVWTTKMLEAALVALSVALLAFLVVYLADRMFDTPQPVRAVLLLLVIVGGLSIPRAAVRWIWGYRRLEQLARLLRMRNPEIGDQLLGVIELAGDPTEQSRSHALCAAAMQQVAERADGRDLRAAAPPAQIKPLAWCAGISGAIAMLLLALYPQAFTNAWERLLVVHRKVPRYTFVTIAPVPKQWIVAHGEPAEWRVELGPRSQWIPLEATLDADGVGTLKASLDQGAYRFSLPPLTEPIEARLHVGDYFQQVRIVPTLRPELTEVVADIELPAYLQRDKQAEVDVRSGSLALVQGSRVVVRAKASRELESVTLGDQRLPTVDGTRWRSRPLLISGESPVVYRFGWIDRLGLAGSRPFELKLEPLPDEPPTVVAQGLSKQSVVMDTEQLNFQALAADDFGVRRIGLQWRSLDEAQVAPPEGDRVLAAGAPTETSMRAVATFSPASFGIEPQPIEVRLWAEDYYPNRDRVYSAPHILFVLTQDQHAVWITEQLSQWQRASLDVRDQELQLFAKNKQLHQLAAQGELSEELQAQIKKQAELETANARQLKQLTRVGAELVRQATRNPAIRAEQLENWAEMLEVLNDIGNQRMPSVAELLDRAAREATAAQQASSGAADAAAGPAGQNQDAAAGSEASGKHSEDRKPAPEKMAGEASKSNPSSGSEQSSSDVPHAGENRAHGAAGSQQASQAPETPDVELPTISDVESTMQTDVPDSQDDSQASPPGAAAPPRLGLPSTQLVGPNALSSKQQSSEQEPPANESLTEALFEQESLLAEFERVSDELNQLLANMEGSTLVKRLKAEARQQQQIANRLASRIGSLFGAPAVKQIEDLRLLDELSEREQSAAQRVSYIMDDIQSYYERRRMGHFKQVLDDMRAMEVLIALRQVAEDLYSEPGLSIAQAEFWADTLDRWGEDLMEPPGDEASSEEESQPAESQPADAIPPHLIVEVLRVLEGEVNLREDTRVAEQARPAVGPAVHVDTALKLSERQAELRERLGGVVDELLQLPNGADRFPDEIELMAVVGTVMDEATALLAQSMTGPKTIAAETEAIELLLQSNRINPQGAGRGAASPGSGSTGTTQDSALALIGAGLNQKEFREEREVTQAVGESGAGLPEEFRAGLDVYFQRIEQVLQ